MAIPILNDLDFNKLQAINVVLHQSATAPTSPVKGQVYCNTGDNIVYYYNGTVWVKWLSYAAGNGLSSTVSGGVETFDVNVDNATVEINADTVRIKDLGVTTGKLADNAVTTIKITDKHITFAKIQDLPIMTVIGSIAGGTPSAIPILNEADLVSNSATALATQSSIKAYVDSRVAGLGKLIGGFDAATNTNFPGVAGTKKGDYWYVTVAGTVQANVFEVGDVIIANQDAPSATNANHYIFLQTNRDAATTSQMGMVILASNAEVQAGTDANKVVTPASLSARSATETRTGLVELATVAEVQAGTDTTRAVTPAGLAARTATETRTGVIEIATNAEAAAGTDDARAITPAKLKYVLQETGSSAYVGNIGDGTAITYSVTHGFNTKDVTVEVFNNTSGQTVLVDIVRNANNTVQINFGTGIVVPLNGFRVIVTKKQAIA